MCPMKTLLLLGDSLIEYGDWQAAFPASRCLNCGVAGETVQGLLMRLPTILHRGVAPDAVVIMAGTNNLAMDDFYFVPQYEEILRLLRSAAPNAKIVVNSLLPVNFSWQPATLVPNLNTRLAAMCRQLDAYYLDLYSLFLAALDSGESVFEDDGVHLSATGYDLWHQALRRVLF